MYIEFICRWQLEFALSHKINSSEMVFAIPTKYLIEKLYKRDKK